MSAADSSTWVNRPGTAAAEKSPRPLAAATSKDGGPERGQGRPEVVESKTPRSPPIIRVRQFPEKGSSSRGGAFFLPPRRQAKTRKELIRDFYEGPVPLAASTPKRKDKMSVNNDNNNNNSNVVPVNNAITSSSSSSVGFATGRRSYSRDGKFQCDVCYRRLGTLLSLEAHRDSFHTPVACQVCPDKPVLNGRSAFKRHTNREHPEEAEAALGGPGGEALQMYVCEHCGKGLTKRASLQAHLRSFHKPRKCKYCDKMIVGVHMRRHIAQEHLSVMESDYHLTYCAECYKVLDRRQLPRHVRIFHEKMRCPDCGADQEGEKAYGLHRKYVHGDQGRADAAPEAPSSSSFSAPRKKRRMPQRFKFHCLRCSFSCLKRKELNDHRIMHHPEAIVDEKDMRKRQRYLAKQQMLAEAKMNYSRFPPLAKATSAAFPAVMSSTASAPTPVEVIATAAGDAADKTAQKAAKVDDSGQEENDKGGKKSVMEFMRMPLDLWPENQGQQLQETHQQQAQITQAFKPSILEDAPPHKVFDPFLAQHCQDAVQNIMSGEFFVAASRTSPTSSSSCASIKVEDATPPVTPVGRGQVQVTFPAQTGVASQQKGQVEEGRGGTVVPPGAFVAEQSEEGYLIFPENEIAFASEEIVGDNETCSSRQQPVTVCEVVTYTCSRCWKNYFLERDFYLHRCDEASPTSTTTSVRSGKASGGRGGGGGGGGGVVRGAKALPSTQGIQDWERISQYSL